MEIGTVSVGLEKRWELNDFAIFAKEYVNIYSFYYTLTSTHYDDNQNMTFSSYPWEGGYSVVNFFRKTYGQIKSDHRPKILKIQYSSPGTIDISCVISVAQDISLLIGVICASAYTINRTYHSIKKSYMQRKLARLKLQEMESRLSKNDIRFIHSSVKILAECFSLKQSQIKALARITEGNELIQLKMLLALYRRAEPLAKQQEIGKTKL